MTNRLPQSATRSNVRPSLPIAAAAAYLLVALAACSGGDDDSPTGNASPTQTSSTSTDGATAGTRTLDELLEAYLTGVDGKITYRTTSENFGEHPNLIWTEYRLGGDTRVDWRNVVENPADDPMITTVAIISNEGDAYICTDSPGLKSCNAKTPEEAQTLIFWRPSVDEAPEAIAEGIDGMTVSDATEREIAGVQASCFAIEVPAGIGIIRPGQTAQESIELCFSPEGALLVMSRTVDFDDDAFPTAKLEVTAQEVAEAEPADFEPPASPLD